MQGKRRSEPVDIHIGQRLRNRRAELGMSQQELGDMVDVAFQQIQRYERGTNRISGGKLYRLAKGLNIPVSYFYEGVEGGPPRPDEADILNRAKARDYLFLRRYLALPRTIQKAAREFVRALGESRNLGD